MTIPTGTRWAAAALLMAPATAHAASLSIVNVSAPSINCIFETDCTITVTDSIGQIPMAGIITGTAILQTRTFRGLQGAPAAGKFGYEYRVDLTRAVPTAEFACVTDVEINFGPVTKLQYNNAGPLDDVFVVTGGGIGTIGLLSAVENHNIITFTFNQPVCAGATMGTGQASFFFGLASTHPPKAVSTKVAIPGLLPVDVKSRSPDLGANPPPLPPHGPGGPL